MLKKVCLLLLLPLFAFGTLHKFYVSVTNVGYSEKDAALQLTSRIFIDDLEELLQERYDIEAHLATDQENALAEAYLQKYLKAKLAIEINGEPRAFEYIGRKYDADVVIFYLEVVDVPHAELKSIQIRNELLTDLFDEQQNIVHFKIDGQKKSFVLMRGNTKGLLNL